MQPTSICGDLGGLHPPYAALRRVKTAALPRAMRRATAHGVCLLQGYPSFPRSAWGRPASTLCVAIDRECNTQSVQERRAHAERGYQEPEAEAAPLRVRRARPNDAPSLVPTLRVGAASVDALRRNHPRAQHAERARAPCSRRAWVRGSSGPIPRIVAPAPAAFSSREPEVPLSLFVTFVSFCSNLPSVFHPCSIRGSNSCFFDSFRNLTFSPSICGPNSSPHAEPSHGNPTRPPHL